MMGAAVLVSTLALLLPNDTRRDGVDVDEGRTDAGWVADDGGCCSVAARPRDLRRFANFRSNALACSRAFSASLRARASAEMRGFVAVVVRAHSGRTYGFFTTSGAGVGFGVATDVSLLDVALAGAACVVFGGEGKAAATRALRAAKRSAFGRGVCVDTGLLG